MNTMQFVIPTLFGLEGLVAEELRRMKVSGVNAENGRVLCSGSAADLAKINLRLRCGERLLISMGQCRAETFEALFEGTKAIPWETLLPRDAAFPVKGFSLNSRLTALPACQAIVKKAIATRLGAHYGLTQLPETGAIYQIQFAIMKDEATLMIDTSGAGLHKRGYRAQGVVAPLRETLAAAMVQLSAYRGRDSFCDPFCGSGTIPIEAALIAKNRAPGLGRSFAAEAWKSLGRDIWTTAAEEARDLEFDGSYDIHGSDIDPTAVRLAESNAKKAGVSELVRFSVADATTFTTTEAYGRLVTNPPYGERIMEKDEAEALYRAFGKTVKTLPAGWGTFLLSSHTEFERSFGATATKKRKLYNGRIKCDLFLYPGKRNSEKLNAKKS